MREEKGLRINMTVVLEPLRFLATLETKCSITYKGQKDQQKLKKKIVCCLVEPSSSERKAIIISN